MANMNKQQLAQYKPPEAPQQEQQITEENCVVHPLRIECCCCDNCPQLRTRTIAVDLGSGSEDQIQQSLVNAANSLEANGWLILGHSLNFRSAAPGEAGGGGAVAVVNLGYYV